MRKKDFFFFFILPFTGVLFLFFILSAVNRSFIKAKVEEVVEEQLSASAQILKVHITRLLEEDYPPDKVLRSYEEEENIYFIALLNGQKEVLDWVSRFEGYLPFSDRAAAGRDTQLIESPVGKIFTVFTSFSTRAGAPYHLYLGYSLESLEDRANSGFDSIEECFEEMTPSIFALETGLSSDPPMNRRLSALDRFALVSNSDAHSPSKIGREANVFDTDFSYRGLVDALRTNDPSKFLYTVEFFPEEGKYHYDGHRKCGVVSAPRESLKTNDLCPKCGKKLTIGVLHRVEELADRDNGDGFPGRIPHKNLIPLNEVIAEALGRTPECQGVWDLYFRFVREFGDEHAILTDVPVAELARVSPENVAEAVDRVRKGQVHIVPGHDGEYGTIRIFNEDASADSCASQLSLF